MLRWDGFQGYPIFVVENKFISKPHFARICHLTCTRQVEYFSFIILIITDLSSFYGFLLTNHFAIFIKKANNHPTRFYYLRNHNICTHGIFVSNAKISGFLA